jgi:hypothetical protein
MLVIQLAQEEIYEEILYDYCRHSGVLKLGFEWIMQLSSH